MYFLILLAILLLLVLAVAGGVWLYAKVVSVLEKNLGDQGFDATKTVDRLKDLQAIQNTYLSTFQSLGALGLLLGTFGLMLFLRNLGLLIFGSEDRALHHGLLVDRLSGHSPQSFSKATELSMLASRG